MTQYKWLIAACLIAIGFYFYPNSNPNEEKNAPQSARAKDIKRVFSSKQKKEESLNISKPSALPPKTEKAPKDLDSESDQKVLEAMKNGTKDRKSYKRLLEEALELNPSNTGALGRYSEALLTDGDIKKSRELSKKCLEIDPSHPICNRSLISSFTRHGQFEEGYEHLLNCLENDPENTHCLGGMLSTLLSLNDIEAAEELIGYLEELEVENIWLALAKGQYYQKVGDNLLALENYEIACDKGQPFACKMVKSLKSM